MHELSIVRQLIEQVQRHTPSGAVVRSLHLRVGAMQPIDPACMALAWKAATEATALQDAVLTHETLPWRMTCPQCQRTWASDDPLAPCTCGGRNAHPHGSNEITLVAIQIDQMPAVERNLQHASTHHRKRAQTQ